MTDTLTPAPDGFAPRMIPLAGTFNARDIGGYTTPFGPIRAGRLLRTDGLHGLDDASRALLVELGVRTVIDLRRDEERAERPDALGDLAVAVRHLSIMSGALPTTLETVPTLAEVYTTMVATAGPALAAAVAALAEPDAIPAIVHCTAGKDRTGVVVAFVLALLGVDDEVIVADYAASADLLRTGGFVAPSAAVPIVDPSAEEALLALLESPGSLIRDVLAAVRASHGSVEAYLLAHGMDPGVPAVLRAGLVA